MSDLGAERKTTSRGLIQDRAGAPPALGASDDGAGVPGVGDYRLSCLGPGVHPAGDAHHGTARRGQHLSRLEGANAATADDREWRSLRHVGESLTNRAQGDVDGVGGVTSVPFVLLADVEDDGVVGQTAGLNLLN